MSTELDTSTVKSIIDDIIDSSESVAKTIKESMSSDVSEENMDLLIQEIVERKTVEIKAKFALLTGKFRDAKSRQLANIATQDKEARKVLTVRHKEQMTYVTHLHRHSHPRVPRRSCGFREVTRDYLEA